MAHSRPIGVLGGTFDPVHYGHLRTAFEVLAQLDLESVLFMPSHQPPHRAATQADPELRLRMVVAGIADQPGFQVDAREFQRSGPSYTVDTLASLREEFRKQPLCLILGMDAFLGLPQWYRWREILRMAHLIVAHRPGWQAPRTGELGSLLIRYRAHQVAELHAEPAGLIYVQPVTQLEIASSAIRALVSRGGDPRFLVPEPVRQLILESGCYGAAAEDGGERVNVR